MRTTPFPSPGCAGRAGAAAPPVGVAGRTGRGARGRLRGTPWGVGPRALGSPRGRPPRFPSDSGVGVAARWPGRDCRRPLGPPVNPAWGARRQRRPRSRPGPARLCGSPALLARSSPAFSSCGAVWKAGECRPPAWAAPAGRAGPGWGGAAAPARLPRGTRERHWYGYSRLTGEELSVRLRRPGCKWLLSSVCCFSPPSMPYAAAPPNTPEEVDWITVPYISLPRKNREELMYLFSQRSRPLCLLAVFSWILYVSVGTSMLSLHYTNKVSSLQATVVSGGSLMSLTE